MRCRPVLALLLCLSGSLAIAEEIVVPVKPPPPRWRQAKPATVVVGADVAPSFDGQLPAANIILRMQHVGDLPWPEPGASECVIEATTTANLASERIIILPRLQRCFDAQGKDLPAKPVNGFAVDKDARVGLKGPIAWSNSAKELLLLGAGSQVRPGYFSRLMSRTLSQASLGLSDEYFNKEDGKPSTDVDTAREIRGLETLLPTLTLEPGRQIDLVLRSGRP